MATTKNDRQAAARRPDPRSRLTSDLGDLGTALRRSSQSGHIVVVALFLILFCLILPILALMYFDVLKVQKQAERDQARIEKVLKSLEEKDKK